MAQYLIAVTYDVIADVEARRDVRGSHNEAGAWFESLKPFLDCWNSRHDLPARWPEAPACWQFWEIRMTAQRVGHSLQRVECRSEMIPSACHTYGSHPDYKWWNAKKETNIPDSAILEKADADHDHHDNINIPFLRETTDPYEFLHIVYNPTDDILTRHFHFPCSNLEKDNPHPFSAKDIPLNPQHHHNTWLRLYKPTTTSPHKLPLILYFHGGGLHPLQRRRLHVSQNSYLAPLRAPLPDPTASPQSRSPRLDPSDICSRELRRIFKGCMHIDGYQWRNVPEDIKSVYWEGFTSEKGGPDAGISKHTGGSRPFYRNYKELLRSSKIGINIREDVYIPQADPKVPFEYSATMSLSYEAEIQRMREEMSQSAEEVGDDPHMDETDLYYKVVSVDHKGRVYGLGYTGRRYNDPGASSSQGRRARTLRLFNLMSHV
ncbi:hypothetical protein Sjap_016091 [Stephania japonica]|uniref:Alpha/beta hydrolase fold-3 domain-containing protein n=1 Tax=Stephania japonica TaxID=461633 RepID=A0AAP0NT62_9MAGN